MKEVFALVLLILSVTSNPIPQCQICQKNPYNTQYSVPSQNNPCTQATMVQNVLPNREELNQLLMSKIMSNQCVQKILDPNIRLYNQNGEEIKRENTPNVVNNYFILPPELFLDKDTPIKKSKKTISSNESAQIEPKVKRKTRVKGTKRKHKTSEKIIKAVEVNKEEDQNKTNEKVKKVKRRNKSSRKHNKSHKTDSAPPPNPSKNIKEEILPPNNKKKKKNKTNATEQNPVAIKNKSNNCNKRRLKANDKINKIPDVAECNDSDFQLKNIESPIDNVEVTKDLIETKLQARNSKSDFSNWPQNNNLPGDLFKGFFPYMDMSQYFSPYSNNYPLDFGQYYQPNQRKRKNRRKYDNNNGEPHVLEIKVKPKDGDNIPKINPNTHVLQIKLKPKKKANPELSTVSPIDGSYEEIELELDPSDLVKLEPSTEEPLELETEEPIEPESAKFVEPESAEAAETDSTESIEPETEVIEPESKALEVKESIETESEESTEPEKPLEEEMSQNQSIEIEENFDSIENFEEDSSSFEKEEHEDHNLTSELDIDVKENKSIEVLDTAEVETIDILKDTKNKLQKTDKENVREMKIEFDVEDLQKNIPDLGKEEKVPTLYSNGIINDYYPIFYDDTFYASDENNYQLKDLNDRLFYITEGQEEIFNRDRRKYDGNNFDYSLPNNLKERMNLRRNYLSSIKNEPKLAKNENFKKPPLLENPGFVSKKIERNSNLDKLDAPVYHSKYNEDNDAEDIGKGTETVFAQTKVVKYGAEQPNEDLSDKSDSDDKDLTYIVTARSMGPVEDFYWK